MGAWVQVDIFVKLEVLLRHYTYRYYIPKSGTDRQPKNIMPHTMTIISTEA